MSDRPVAPFVSAEVDLTDFKFMPLEVSRLLASEWWIVACTEDPRRAVAAVNLWARAWHQRPAASLPNNDVVLATMALVPLAVWREIRDAVMGPWVLCSDGRWYHPVVAEKANEAWETKRSYTDRETAFRHKQSQRAKKRWQKAADADADATADAGNMPRHCHGTDAADANESNSNSNSKGNYVPQSAKALFPTADADGVPAKGPKGEGYTAEFEAWWSLYPRKTDKGSAFRAFVTAKKLVPIDRLMDGVRAYAARMKGEDPQFIKHAATWLIKHCWNDEPQTPQKRKYPPGYVPMGPHGG